MECCYSTCTWSAIVCNSSFLHHPYRSGTRCPGIAEGLPHGIQKSQAIIIEKLSQAPSPVTQPSTSTSVPPSQPSKPALQASPPSQPSKPALHPGLSKPALHPGLSKPDLQACPPWPIHNYVIHFGGGGGGGRTNVPLAPLNKTLEYSFSKGYNMTNTQLCNSLLSGK